MRARDKRVWPQELIDEVLLWRWEKKNPATNRPYTSDEIASILKPRWDDITPHHISKIAIAGGHRRIREHRKTMPLGKKYSGDRRAAFYPGQKQDEPMSENLPAVPELKMIDGIAWADSRDVAHFFGKRHDDVLKAIRNIGCSPEFRQRNFAEFKINDLTGQTTSHVLMTENGFTGLGMGFTGPEAWRFKEAYIGEFDRMRHHIKHNAIDGSAFLAEMREARISTDRRFDLLMERQDRILEALLNRLPSVSADVAAAPKDQASDPVTLPGMCAPHQLAETTPPWVIKRYRLKHMQDWWIGSGLGSMVGPFFVANAAGVKSGYFVNHTGPVRGAIHTWARLTQSGVDYFREVFRSPPSSHGASQSQSA